MYYINNLEKMKALIKSRENANFDEPQHEKNDIMEEYTGWKKMMLRTMSIDEFNDSESDEIKFNEVSAKILEIAEKHFSTRSSCEINEVRSMHRVGKRRNGRPRKTWSECVRTWRRSRSKPENPSTKLDENHLFLIE